MAVSRSTIAAIRFGYGLAPGEDPPKGAEALLDGLAAAQTAPFLDPPGPLAARRKRAYGLQLRRKEEGRTDEIRRLGQKMKRDTRGDYFARLVQRADGPSGFFERLSAFWADHFTVAARGPNIRHMVPVYEPDTIRPHVTGRFADMLLAVSRSPIMLHYLDQRTSMGPDSQAGKRSGKGLNENLAREILELHTLGVDGPYTQDDVRQLAELLTGLTFRHQDAEFVFRPNRAEPGAEQVLGQSYGGRRRARLQDVDQALLDLAHHPVTAKHVARKLAVHFVADEPPEDLVAHIEAAWRKTDGDLMAVYGALLEHPASWDSFGHKVKRPIEFMVSLMRATGLHRRLAKRPKEQRKVLAALTKMNQPLFAAPGPDGWPEENAAWITPQGLAVRLEVASQVGNMLADRERLDPRRFARRTLADALGEDTAFVVAAAPDRWESFALTFASPEFNRR